MTLFWNDNPLVASAREVVIVVLLNNSNLIINAVCSITNGSFIRHTFVPRTHSRVDILYTLSFGTRSSIHQQTCFITLIWLFCSKWWWNLYGLIEKHLIYQKIKLNLWEKFFPVTILIFISWLVVYFLW